MISSNLHSLHARERQREMIAQADRHRLVRQLRDVTRASRLVGPTRGPRRGIWVRPCSPGCCRATGRCG